MEKELESQKPVQKIEQVKQALNDMREKGLIEFKTGYFMGKSEQVKTFMNELATEYTKIRSSQPDANKAADLQRAIANTCKKTESVMLQDASQIKVYTAAGGFFGSKYKLEDSLKNI